MRTREYINAVDEAFKPWLLDWPPGYVECAFKFAGCQKTFPRNEIAACHIYGVGAHEELRNEAANILPGCAACHRKFDGKGRAVKNAIVEAMVPGRMPALERLRKERVRAKIGIIPVSE